MSHQRHIGAENDHTKRLAWLSRTDAEKIQDLAQLPGLLPGDFGFLRHSVMVHRPALRWVTNDSFAVPGATWQAGVVRVLVIALLLANSDSAPRVVLMGQVDGFMFWLRTLPSETLCREAAERYAKEAPPKVTFWCRGEW